MIARLEYALSQFDVYLAETIHNLKTLSTRLPDYEQRSGAIFLFAEE